MFSRVVRFVTSLAIVGCAYFAYRLAVVPLIEPAPQPRAAGSEAEWSPGVDSSADLLRAIFPPGSWELQRPKVLETDRGMLLLKELSELDEHRLELKPCTLILFSGNDKDRASARPVVLQANEGAVLTFDDPLNLARGQIGRLARGTLPGPVTIRSPESRPGAADQIEIVTHNVQLSRDRIEAPQPIRFRYGRSYGSGRDLIIHLSHPVQTSSLDAQNAARRAAPTIASAELVHVDRIRLQLDNPHALDATDQLQNPSNSLELEITCQGPFKFDFDRRRATFEDQVDVIRVPTSGAVDQLSCQHLAVYFTRPAQRAAANPSAAPGAAATDAASALTPDLRGLKVERVRAAGTPAVVSAPSFAATLRAESFEYNFVTREVKIEDRQKLMLRYQGYDVEARHLEYRFADEGRLGELKAIGPGRAHGTLAERDGQSVEAAWNDRVILQRHQGEQVVSLLGGGWLRVYGEGEFAARDLHVWFSEAPERRAGSDKPRYRYQPLRMLAEGDVRVDSWQLAGAMQRAEIWVRHEAEPPGQGGSAPASRTDSADRRERPNQKFDVAAEHLQMQLVRRGSQTSVANLILDGRVALREVRTAKADDVPLSVVGDLVQLDDAQTDAARLAVQGRPAEVSARGLNVTGGDIQVRRGDNRIWIDGPGRMILPTPDRSRASGAPRPSEQAAARPLDVQWKGRMEFDGRVARFLRDVQVRATERLPPRGNDAARAAPSERGRPSRLVQENEAFDLLVMGHELSVTLNQAVSLNQSRPPEDLNVHELAFVGGVYLQNTGRRRDAQTSFDQLQVRDLTIEHSSGLLRAAGPGWGSTVRYDRSFGEGGVNRLAGATDNESRLVYIRVDYDDEIRGDIASRHLSFAGRVRTLYGPVETWDRTLDPDPMGGLGRGQFLLTSDRLSVSDAASSIPGGQTGLELAALGNATIEGDAFSARAWRVAYAKAKELVILEGDGRTDAELWRKGSSAPDAAAQQIRFWTTNQSVQVDGGRFLNLGGLGMPLALPKR